MINLETLKHLAGLLVSPPVDPRRQARRIQFMEQNVLLPIKIAIIGTFLYYLFFAGWFDGATFREYIVFDLPLSVIKRVFLLYASVNLVGAVILIRMRRFSLNFIQWTVFGINFLDALFVGALAVVTGGLDNYGYWVYLALIVRNAMSVPVAPLQITLNGLLVTSYLVAGILENMIVEYDLERQLALSEPQDLQSFVVRIFLMLSLMASCYGVQILFDRQRQAEEELEDVMVSQKQLQTAGRLAAEIAHQIKNPLAIMNNTVFTLQRALKEGKNDVQGQLQILREEIERSDRIITELMGYAQLAEGKVEKLDVAEEIDKAIAQVFPPGAEYDIRVHREVARGLPSLQMQRGHLREALVNLLQNAREALHGKGNVRISARLGEGYSVVIQIADDGPGIPPETEARIFEPYFTMKEKGTGLGLAIVKHNIDIYGGMVRVESALGKGTAFVLELPAKTVLSVPE